MYSLFLMYFTASIFFYYFNAICLFAGICRTFLLRGQLTCEVSKYCSTPFGLSVVISQFNSPVLDNQNLIVLRVYCTTFFNSFCTINQYIKFHNMQLFKFYVFNNIEVFGHLQSGQFCFLFLKFITSSVVCIILYFQRFRSFERLQFCTIIIVICLLNLVNSAPCLALFRMVSTEHALKSCFVQVFL